LSRDAMADSATPRLRDAFHQEVKTFHTSAFSLADDLDWLGQHRIRRAPVAAILHSARILEVLVRHALAVFQLPKADHILTLQNTLLELTGNDHLSKEAHVLLTQLRVLGNEKRHVVRIVSFEDAEQGYAILLRGLQWHFCEFPRGPRLTGMCAYHQSLGALLPPGLATLVKMLDSADLNARGFLELLRLEKPDCPVLASPVLVAVVAERLLDGLAGEQAQVVLAAARGRFPDNVRLRQLQGLLWSRAGRLVEACDWLEAIETTDSAAAEETQGILAGAYKKRAKTEPRRSREWLAKSHTGYERAWRRSQRLNTHLDINAAATALWLGLPGQAEPIAESIRTLLEDRRRRLEQTDAEPARKLHCWGQLTLAEAHLLLQRWDDARKCYREAVERFPHLTGDLQVAREQANRDLVELGRSDLIGDIIPR